MLSPPFTPFSLQVLLTLQMQLAESTTLNKVLDFELRHLQGSELPRLKVKKKPRAFRLPRRCSLSAPSSH